jgi:hypothetical protein
MITATEVSDKWHQERKLNESASVHRHVHFRTYGQRRQHQRLEAGGCNRSHSRPRRMHATLSDMNLQGRRRHPAGNLRIPVRYQLVRSKQRQSPCPCWHGSCCPPCPCSIHSLCNAAAWCSVQPFRWSFAAQTACFVSRKNLSRILSLHLKYSKVSQSEWQFCLTQASTPSKEPEIIGNQALLTFCFYSQDLNQTCRGPHQGKACIDPTKNVISCLESAFAGKNNV